MIALYIMLALILIPLILALFISKDMNYEKSISINAPVKTVWKNVNSRAAMDSDFGSGLNKLKHICEK